MLTLPVDTQFVPGILKKNPVVMASGVTEPVNLKYLETDERNMSVCSVGGIHRSDRHGHGDHTVKSEGFLICPFGSISLLFILPISTIPPYSLFPA